MDPSKKYLFIPDNDPRIDGSRDALDSVIKHPDKLLSLVVDFFQARELDSAPMQIVVAAQHQRKWIEIMLERCMFFFKNGPMTNEIIAAEYGNIERSPVRQWIIHAANSFPAIIFFLKDFAWGRLMLARDFSEGVILKHNVSSIGAFYDIEFTPEQKKLYDNRLFESALNFYTYCNQTGVKPDKVIKEMLSALKSSYTLESVKDRWLNEDVPYGFG